MGLPSSAALLAAVLSVCSLLASADLPVHCLRHQVAGEWEFTLGPLANRRSSCGHKRPDSQNEEPPLNFVTSSGPTSKLAVSLRDPDTVVGTDGSSGSWTMIYDEGFEVRIGSYVYFAFSRFDFVDDGHGGQTNVSHCGETQVGWYHSAERNQWGCYVGRQVGASASASSADAEQEDADGTDSDARVAAAPARSTIVEAATALDQTLLAPSRDDDAPPAAAQQLQEEDSGTSAAEDVVQRSQSEDRDASEADDNTGSEGSVVLQTKTSSDYYAEPPEYKPWVPSSNGFDKPMPKQWQESVAAALNFLQLGWTAATYEMFKGKTPRELNKFAGVRRDRPKANVTNTKRGAVAPAAATATSFLGIQSKRHRQSTQGDHFDWREKDGANWMPPVVTQGDCGSCYTISTVHMLTARNRIHHQSLDQPSFSVSFPLYCSEYNQGCDGGYGFLQSKWAEDVGLVPESCLPFSQGGGSCQIAPGCDLGASRFRATNHHYVGGFYGASDADLIRQELVSNGPVVMSFEPKEDFMYYKQGIYRSGPNKIHQEWEQVDHAVLLAGYGEEAGQKYWTLQNSWGEDWGEAGYFRMARGTDESGCESIVVAAEVLEEEKNPVLEEFIASL